MTKYCYNFKSLNETLMIRYENATTNVLNNASFSIAKPYDQKCVYERIVIWLTSNLPSNGMTSRFTPTLRKKTFWISFLPTTRLVCQSELSIHMLLTKCWIETLSLSEESCAVRVTVNFRIASDTQLHTLLVKSK